LGLAHDVTLTRDIAEGEALKWSDVLCDREAPAVRVRREMEALFGGANSNQGADQRRQ
jgi:predicted homoserine dehydrogenase-like protein